MELGNLSALYLEDVRFAASSMGIGKNALEGGPRRPGETAPPGFADLLEKNYAAIAPAASTAPGATPPAAAAPPAAASSTPPSSLLTPPFDKLYEQCEALETFLVKILINGMRNTVQKSGFIDEGFAGKMYEDMLYDEYARDFTKNANFGLAELAYMELTGQRGKLISTRA
jgi:flagellar protein FlgJ